MSHLSVESRFLHDHDSYMPSCIPPNLGLMLKFLPDFPLSWRKAGITYCRVQEHSDQNIRISNLFDALEPTGFMTTLESLDDYYHKAQFLNCLDDFNDSPLILSLIQGFLKFEMVNDQGELFEVLQKSISKELDASQYPNASQLCFYGPLFNGNGNIIPTRRSTPGQLMQLWKDGFRIFQRRVSERIFLPVFSYKKNLGHLTSQALAFYRQEEWEVMTTGLDLEVHYMQTGQQIRGPVEMRSVWRYNDIKPRIYYATGGTMYFISRYMRDIVYELVNILPSTNVNSRFDISRVTSYPLGENEVVITYDYSSFTTSLSELKYFLHRLGLELQGTKVRVLDFNLGIITLDVGELLLEYNEVANYHGAFDVGRVTLTEPGNIMHQNRSGMLGVQANIGLSTLLHGIYLASVIDNCPNQSVVGDDALYRCLRSQMASTTHHVQNLLQKEDAIPDEKFSTFVPETSYYEEPFIPAVGWQYLKKPLTIDGYGYLQQGHLNAFPNLASLFDISDDFHVSSSTDPSTRLSSYTTQLGSFMRKCSREFGDQTSIEDIETVLYVVKRVYQDCGLPDTGALPGFTTSQATHVSRDFRGVVNRGFTPPLAIESFTEDWVDVLFREFQGQSFIYPRYSDVRRHAEFCTGVGQEFDCTTHRIQKIVVQMRIFEANLPSVVYNVSEDEGIIIKEIFSGAMRPFYHFKVVAEPPYWYNDYMTQDVHPYEEREDPYSSESLTQLFDDLNFDEYNPF